MLFINLDLIMELLGYNIHECSKENKLLYYNDISSDSTLEEDIALNSLEKNVVNSFCELEIYKSSLIGNNVAGQIRRNFGLSVEKEKELFTKLLVRDYLVQKENRIDLSLANYLSTEKLFSDVAINDQKERLMGIKLFEDFASIDVKNDKEFAKVILQLEGSYITSMGEIVKKNANLMEIAINNDTTKDVVSFSNPNSKLKTDSELAILFFQKMKENQGKEFSADKIYKTIFKQEEGNYVNTIFKNNEQSLWIQDPKFLPKLAKIDSEFVDFISDGKIAPLDSNLNHKTMIKNK